MCDKSPKPIWASVSFGSIPLICNLFLFQVCSPLIAKSSENDSSFCPGEHEMIYYLDDKKAQPL